MSKVEAKARLKRLISSEICQAESPEQYANELMKLAKSIEDEASLKLEANFFKALADVTRLRIVKMLSVREMCVCEIMIALNMSQPNVSHHLEMLERVGIVKKKKEGKWTFYSLAKPEIVRLLDSLFTH